MVTWSLRRSGYKLGVLVLFFGSASYLIGFASPFWIDQRSESQSGYRLYTGLWMRCVEYRDEYDHHDSGCVAISIRVRDKPDWFIALQVMESVGLVILFGANVYAVVVNWCRTPVAAHTRYLEALSALGGVCGFSGGMVFVGKAVSVQSDLTDDMGWAFGLNVTGSILAFVAAVTIYVNNRPHPADAVPPGTLLFTGAAAGPAHVVLQQGQAYPPPGQGGYPPQPWVGYVATPGYGYHQGNSGTAQYPAAGYAPATVSVNAAAGYGGYAPATASVNAAADYKAGQQDFGGTVTSGQE